MFSFNWYFDCLIGQGVFDIAMKATYQSEAIFLEQIKSYSPYVSSVGIKSDKTRKYYTVAWWL